MTRIKRFVLLARFFWLIGRLTVYVWVLRLIGAEKELAKTRAWFLAVLNDAGMLRTMPTQPGGRPH